MYLDPSHAYSRANYVIEEQEETMSPMALQNSMRDLDHIVDLPATEINLEIDSYDEKTGEVELVATTDLGQGTTYMETYKMRVDGEFTDN